MRRTTQISLIFGTLLAGVVLGRFGLSAGWAVVAALGTVSLLAYRSRFFLATLIVLALSLGLACTTHWATQRARLTGLIGQTVTLTGTIADDPAATGSGGTGFKLGNLSGPTGRLPETVSVYLYPYQLQRGYRLEVTGRLKPGYGNAAVQMSFPQITVLSRQQDWLERLRQRFFTGMKTALPEPLSSFGLGLLVGIRALIPKTMQDQLTLVGLSHLVAVSGYNLTIIVQAVDRLLKRTGKGISLAVSLWLIAGFLIVTGAGASIVRAALVSVLSLLAAFYGRRFDPLVLILITGSLTAAVNPAYLTDLGWLLSFLAFYGILVVAPAVEARLNHPKPVMVRLLIESTAAQLVTLPLVLYIFGNLSVVEPLSNLFVLPLVPLAMAASFVAGLAGMLVPAFAGWLAWPAALILWLMTQAIDQFAALPWAGRQEHLDLSAMLAMYAVVLGLVIVMRRVNHRSGRKNPEPSRTSAILQ